MIGCIMYLAAVKFAAAEQPNVIYIKTDDQRFDSLSMTGHPVIKTPNIDRLAKNGALFTQSFCTNSICGPSRAVILTGKHSHVNGFRQNGDHFDGSQPTLPKILKANGKLCHLIFQAFNYANKHIQPQRRQNIRK